MFKRENGSIKFNIIDIAIIAIIGICLIGLLFTKLGIIKTSGNIIKKEQEIQFVVITRAYDILDAEELIKPGDKTFITIRNVPYTKLEVVDVKTEKLKEMFFNYDRPEMPYLYENLAYPYKKQYIITLKDKAQVTKDGAVIGGNKIKIGLPIDLEGFKYRISGTVSDIKLEEDLEK